MLESTWKVLECKSCKFCICWQFWSRHLYACHQYLETVFDFTSVSHCSLNFECPRLGYGFLSIILVLEKCNLGPWKSLNFVLWVCYEPCIYSLSNSCLHHNYGTLWDGCIAVLQILPHICDSFDTGLCSTALAKISILWYLCSLCAYVSLYHCHSNILKWLIANCQTWLVMFLIQKPEELHWKASWGLHFWWFQSTHSLD